jgi:hypothetical protein
MQFWTTASFSLKLTNSVVGSEVMINQDSINGYKSLGFDMSNFNEDGSGDMFTVGTCKPIRIVQLRDAYTWSKYSQRVFPIDVLDDFSERMISEQNNVNELFCQNMTEFLQTDINGSLNFSSSATTIHSIEKYLETFYMPPLDVDGISSIWDQILMDYKRKIHVADDIWEFARKASIIPFSIFMSMFHQHFTEHRFLESTLELLQQFYIQVESVAKDYKVFPGDQSTFSLKCFCCGKKSLPQKHLQTYYSWHQWLYIII